MRALSPFRIAVGGSLVTVALLGVLIPAVSPASMLQSLAVGCALIPLFAGLAWAASVDARTRHLESQIRECRRVGRIVAAVWLLSVGFVAACQVHRIPGVAHGIAFAVMILGGIVECCLSIRIEHLEMELRRRGRIG
ncbi:MAG TPA: hypothetical protein VE981_04585 [Planctomycetota bacterium]|nr:hypothetical protein [Planctomycetota bacterium]